MSMKKNVAGVLKALILPLAVYMIFMLIEFDRFASVKTFTTILTQSIIPTIIGYGICFSFFCGIFDFAIGARVIISGLIGGILCMQFGISGLIIGSIGVSVALGIITGLVNKYARIPSIVVTIGLAMIFEVVGYKIIGNMTYVQIATEDSILANNPYIVIVFLISAVIFYLVLTKTRFSSHARAIGSEEDIAKNMGIKVETTKMVSFIIGAIFLGIVTVLQVSQTGVIAPQINLTSATFLFKPLMGVLVAQALESQINLVAGIFIGEFTITTIFIGLIAAGLPDTMQDVMLGVFLLVVMLISANRDKLFGFRNRVKLARVKD